MSARRWWCAVFAGALLLVLIPERPASARPMGGQSYSGASRGGGGSGSGQSDAGTSGSVDVDVDPAAAEAVAGLFAFLGSRAAEGARASPLTALVLCAAVGLIVAFRHRLDVDLGDWSLGRFHLPGDPEAPSARSAPPDPEPDPGPLLPRAELEQLVSTDPAFSIVLFEDFAHVLFARAHEARGRGALETLAPHLSPGARAELATGSGDLAAVEGIVVGAMRYHRVEGLQPDSPRVRVTLELEATYSEVARLEGGGSEPRGLYTCERWTLTRRRSARSRPPERIQSLGCPACGGPLEAAAGACAWCGAAFEGGEQDWLVTTVDVLRRERRAPALTTQPPVPDYFFPPDPIVAPDLRRRRAELEQRDPGFDGGAFHARVRRVFAELQPAWSQLDLTRARPWLSDNLFEAWRYWIEAYRRAGLRNISEDARIDKLRTVRVASDLHYDAITVWLQASGLDYTVDAQGQLVCGDRERRRPYCEYWTLIRGRGVSGSARADTSCPRCGAPLAVSMAGSCDSCGAHVTAGEFDWVLSRIEQESAYQG